MKKLFLLTLALAALTSCAKRVDDTNVAGTDEEQLDRYAARLEEMRSRAKAESLSCADNCAMAKESCDLSKRICDISTRQPTAQDRCVGSNEDCASFNDACGSCGGR